jgi:hypothetical protein
MYHFQGRDVLFMSHVPRVDSSFIACRGFSGQLLYFVERSILKVQKYPGLKPNDRSSARILFGKFVCLVFS